MEKAQTPGMAVILMGPGSGPKVFHEITYDAPRREASCFTHKSAVHSAPDERGIPQESQRR